MRKDKIDWEEDGFAADADTYQRAGMSGLRGNNIWEDPERYEVKKEKAHATMMPYPGRE